MTLLSIVNTVQDRLSLPRSGSVIGSTSKITRQMLALVNLDGQVQVKRHAWYYLTKEDTFSTTATQTQASFTESDFDRFVDGSMWNRSRKQPMTGPLTPSQWQVLKVRTLSSIYPVWRRTPASTSSVDILPVPAAGETIAYEYTSKNWVSGAAQTSSFVADTDTSLIDETLIQLGLTWRFLKAKRLSWEEEYQEAEAYFQTLIAQETGRRTLKMGRTVPLRYQPPDPVIPDQI